jgi:hypoxanthine phosphoribosyltransferase
MTLDAELPTEELQHSETVSASMNVDWVGECNVLIPEPAIEQRVRTLGSQIGRDFAGLDLVLIGVLTGALTFTADLARHISLPVELDFVAASSYGHGTETSGEVRLLKDLSHPIQGKHVLLIEDIIDTGTTLRYLIEMLQARQPASISVCALLDKPSRRAIDVPVEYVGFTIEDRFVVGYGLDFAGKYRNLPFIAEINPPVSEA